MTGFLVDSGTNGPRNLNPLGYPAGRVSGVFLSHFHSDHIDGLGELATFRWSTGNKLTPLPVWSEGVEQVVASFNAAYSQDFIYRNAHHGDNVAPMSAASLIAKPFVTADGELALVYEGGGLVVEALRVDHEPVRPLWDIALVMAAEPCLSAASSQSDNIGFRQGHRPSTPRGCLPSSLA